MDLVWGSGAEMGGQSAEERILDRPKKALPAMEWVGDNADPVFAGEWKRG